MPTYTQLLSRRTVTATLILAGMGAALQAQTGLGMSPMRIDLRLGEGQQRSGALMLSNETDVKVRARAELLDFMIDGNDTVQFKRAIESEANYSCRQWLSVNPMEVELAPRSQQMVRYTIRVPQAAAAGSFHCAAGYTTINTAEQMTTEGIGLRIAVRVVAAFYVVTGNPPIEGGIQAIQVEPLTAADTPGWQSVVVMENPGLMHYRPTGELALLDGAGKVLETQPFNPLPVLPRRQQRFLFRLKTPLDSGEYRLRARVDVGTNEIQEGSIVFQVPAAVR